MSPTTGDALMYGARIRDLILHHLGGWADTAALSAFRHLSHAAAQAARDPACVELMRLADQYASELFSERGHAAWARGKTSGPDVLRLCILGKLDAFRERVLALRGVAPVDRDRRAGDEVGGARAEKDRNSG
jgi:hypothetical protein